MRVCFFIVVLWCSINSSFAQTKDLISNCFLNNGDRIEHYFNESIELELPNTKGIYNKNQASIVIKDFFKNNKVSNYTIRHKGGGNGKSFFQIGKLDCGKKHYRTYLLYNTSQETIQIIELRIELEE